MIKLIREKWKKGRTTMEKAYDFKLNDSEGNEVALHDFLGQKVVVYFYPKDSTPGCTKQACS